MRTVAAALRDVIAPATGLRRAWRATLSAIGLATGLACIPLSPAPAQPTPEGTPATPGQAPATLPEASSAATAPDGTTATEDYALHGQATLLEQYHPGFHSAYRGPNSLDPGRRGNETLDFTLYGGVRPWAGAEVWVNPEIDQGFGLSNTVGVAGFPSAEAYKVGAAEPYIRVPRLFVRQTIDVGGEEQATAADLNQLAGRATPDRIVVTIGKYSIVDVFDTNRYAHDPRNDFMNWTIVDAGAFDYAADAWGYAYGGSAEWYQDWWTLRAGLFNGSVTPNSKYAESPLFRQYQVVGEAEARYTLLDQPGKLKLLGFQTRARLGRFSDLERFFTAHPSASNVDAQVARRLRNKFGGAVNVEQPVAPGLGAFLRASLSDGRTEAYDFTDVDRSVSAGLSLAGDRWGRPDDTLGAAFVVNNISKAHKQYFEQGFLGVLVGDGALVNAGSEQIVEVYYSYDILPGFNASLDYQFVNHPAYNVDRGPVHAFGGRLHAQF